MLTTLRNADLGDFVQVLKSQADVRYDVVANSRDLRFEGGQLIVTGTEATITDEGVTREEICLTPTDIFDSGISERLSIPRQYVRRMRDEAVAYETDQLATAEQAGLNVGEVDLSDNPYSALLDTNVNTWLDHNPRRWFVRAFKPTTEPCGIARAFLSDQFNCIDNYDVLLAVLDGVRASGVPVEVTSANLSERRMDVRIEAPGVRGLAPTLLKNYRSPFTGERGADNPVVHAGFRIRNSETGGGAFTIVPELTVLVCKNGMTMVKEAVRKVHLGRKMDEGLIRWSDETKKKNVELVRAQTVDAVQTFLDIDYITKKIDELEGKSAVEVPTTVIEHVSNALGFTESEEAGILDHFIKGGDVTSGGVMHAVTSFAQTIDDPDRAIEVGDQGVAAMDAALASV